MYHAPLQLWKSHLLKGLDEDQAFWDLTTRSVVESSSNQKIQTAQIVAKASGVWAASGLNGAVADLSREWGDPIEISSRFKDGKKIRPGDVVAVWKGSAAAILRFERVFLNLASYVCGIASRTDTLNQMILKKKLKRPPRLAPTRKTLPFYKDLALFGVVTGGAYLHRMNLAGGILIKENHIAAAGGIKNAIQRAHLNASHALRVEVEVRNLKELQEALDSEAEIVMLDNFKPEMVRKAVKKIKTVAPKTIVEVSGGIDEKTISRYCIEGVDVISVGSLTHSVTALDLSLLFKK